MREANLLTEKKTFVHRFKGGIACEMTVSPKLGIRSANWSRRPKMTGGFFREYLRWQRQVIESLANDSGQSIAQMVQVGPDRWTMLSARPQGESTEGTKK